MVVPPPASFRFYVCGDFTWGFLRKCATQYVVHSPFHFFSVVGAFFILLLGTPLGRGGAE